MKLFSSLMLTLFFQVSLPAMACGYDEVFNNPFTLGHSGSIGVALQTNQALEKGALARIPSLTANESLDRANQWLEQLRGELESAKLPERFSVYLVDAGLWTRFDVTNDKVSLKSHTEPETNETVLVISEAALSALLQQQINALEAEKMGVLRWSAPGNPKVAAALNSATQS